MQVALFRFLAHQRQLLLYYHLCGRVIHQASGHESSLLLCREYYT